LLLIGKIGKSAGLLKMKPNSDKLPIKAIAFAGCSFTWGQGLHYYSNLPNMQEPGEWLYDSTLVSFVNYEFIKSVRFPRLVANHFNTCELTQPFNGGNTERILNWWHDCFDLTNLTTNQLSINSIDSKPKYIANEVSHLIFQFTQWHRTARVIEFLGKNYGTYTHNEFWNTESNLLLRWLKKNKMTLDDYIEKAKQEDVLTVKKYLQIFESKGIKTYILSWPADLLPYIKQDNWLSEKLITIKYKGNEYFSIEDLKGPEFGGGPNPELTIKLDTDHFEIPPKDNHPSLKCHQVIANSIINHLENEF